MKGGIGSYIRGGGLEGTGVGTSEKKKWRGGWRTNGEDIWRRKHGQLNWSSRRGGGLGDMRRWDARTARQPSDPSGDVTG
jgi:hypothetical protein